MWKILAVVALAGAALAGAAIQQHGIGPALPSQLKLAGERIAGGAEAAPGQFPHQVGIFVTGGQRRFCGGAVLSANVVVSAAHCVKDGTLFKIIFGAHNIKVDAPLVRSTTNKIVHEKYQDDGFLSNDIALLYFYDAIDFSSIIQPVRLPSTAGGSYWWHRATMSGWGAESEAEGCTLPGVTALSDTLRFVETRVLSSLYCKLRFHFQLVRDTNICTSGWKGKGACAGDSGAPLVVYEGDGKPTLVGMASFGANCEASWPTVSVRLTSYVDWIRASVEAVGLSV